MVARRMKDYMIMELRIYVHVMGKVMDFIFLLLIEHYFT